MIQNQTSDGRTQAGAIAFWLTPHGFLKGAAANPASAKAAVVRGKRTVTFTAFGKFPITATLDDKNVVEHVETLVDNVFTGDTPIDGTYSDYRVHDGILVPTHIVMREGGFPILDIAVAQARPNSPETIDVVARAISAPPPATPPSRPAPPPETIAAGIWQPTPNGEGSVLVEFKDYVVMVEAPISDAVSAASIEAAKRLAPGKPIKYVINTHHHADHSGGLRAYVAEGVPIITHESHRKYYEEQIFKNPHSLNPDRLARMPRAPDDRDGEGQACPHRRRHGAGDPPDERAAAHRRAADGVRAEGEDFDPGRRVHPAAGRAAAAGTEPAHDQSGGQRVAVEAEGRARGARSRRVQSVQRGPHRGWPAAVDELMVRRAAGGVPQQQEQGQERQPSTRIGHPFLRSSLNTTSERASTPR